MIPEERLKVGGKLTSGMGVARTLDNLSVSEMLTIEVDDSWPKLLMECWIVAEILLLKLVKENDKSLELLPKLLLKVKATND